MNNNIIFAVLHLKEASLLLKYAIPDVSDTLLMLSKTIIDNEKINQSDIDLILSLVNNTRNVNNEIESEEDDDSSFNELSIKIISNDK